MLNEILEELKDLSDGRKMLEINTYVNTTITYEHEGRKDIWQTLAETYAKKTGDCEDFALAKYSIARLAGIPEADLHLVVAFIKEKVEPHMVLRWKDVIYDNRIFQAMPVGQCELIPIYAFNADRGILLDRDWKFSDTINKPRLWREFLDRQEEVPMNE